MKIKERLIEVKDKVVDFLDRHETAVLYGVCWAIVGGFGIYLKGAYDGVHSAREEWDFDNCTSDMAVIADDNGEFLTALPMAAIKEVMDKHKPIEWNNSMWKR